MSSRNHTQWNATPDLQRGEWVDSRIYSDEQIFEDELKQDLEEDLDPRLS